MRRGRVEDISLTINAKRVSCPPGKSILEAAEQKGIKIPRLCYHPDLEPYGACRLCLVEDRASGRLMASCVTPVASNMEILTDSPRIKRHRTNIVRLMMAEHPESCVVCSKGNRCQLREIATDLGLGQTNLYAIPNYRPLEQANPFITRDLSKCILCGKCIRADHELVVTGAIDYNLRGFKSRPSTVYDLTLEQSNCTFCGTCVSMCPTGALAPTNTRWVGTPLREASTICGFCGVGCSVVMGVAEDRVIETGPSHLQGSVNGATLCVRGHFAHDFLNSGGRLTQPMIRKGDDMVAVSWDEALEGIAGRLLEIKKEYGPQSLALFGSSKCTNEENYLFQKIARVLLGTNNVDNGGYRAGRSALILIDQRIGGGYRISPLTSLEKAESIVVLGADPSHSTPVLSYYLKRSARRGTPLIVVDPRKTDLVPFSSLWLPTLPGRDVDLINCLAALLWKKFAHDTNFIDRFTEGFSTYNEGLSAFNIERLCVASGTDIEALERASDLLKGKRIAFVVGHGITQQKGAAKCIDAILNLSLMTGSLGAVTGGLYLLARENNEVGAWDMGAVPHGLPGRQLIKDDTARHQWERTWKATLSPDGGLNVVRMIEEAERGNLKALYLMGENPVRSLPDPERTRKALERLDFLVVQDILENETSELADAVLPAAAFSEKGGSFTNMEGRIQSFEPVVSPPGDARPDWEILDLLSMKIGYPVRYRSLDMIRAEIAQLVPMYAGLNGNSAVGWIKETGHKRLFRPDGQGQAISFSAVAPTAYEVFDDGYPLIAILGSLRYHLGSGTRTTRSERIEALGLKGEVEISPKDAERLNLQDGEAVRIESVNGAVVREIRLERSLRQGHIFVPMTFNGNDAASLLELSPLGEAGFPGWKTCRVKIEKM